jgi:cell wall-associated NlpC family hydrolase
VAIRIPAKIRQLSIIAAGATVVALVVTTPAIAAPASPAPTTVAGVQAKLHTLSHQNEMLSEKLNLVIADIATKETAAKKAQAVAAVAVANYTSERDQLTATLTAQYEGSASFSRAGALLNSDSTQNYVDRLTTLSMMSQHRSAILSDVANAKAAAAQAQGNAQELLTAALTTRNSLTQQQTVLASDTRKFTALLFTLNAQQRAAYQNAGKPSFAVDTAQLMIHAGPKAAQTAVNFALKQVGKPYVYDAAGPGSYDCSGLTMASYAAAGVTLPHNAAAQYGYGTHVAYNALQPGDLLFFYQPIGHVTIYIGNGLMVSAPQTGQDVMVVTVASERDIYTGATRLT